MKDARGTSFFVAVGHKPVDGRCFPGSMIQYFDITVIFVCYALLRMPSVSYRMLPDDTSLRPGRDLGEKK